MLVFIFLKSNWLLNKTSLYCLQNNRLVLKKKEKERERDKYHIVLKIIKQPILLFETLGIVELELYTNLFIRYFSMCGTL